MSNDNGYELFAEKWPRFLAFLHSTGVETEKSKEDGLDQPEVARRWLLAAYATLGEDVVARVANEKEPLPWQETLKLVEGTPMEKVLMKVIRKTENGDMPDAYRIFMRYIAFFFLSVQL